MLAVAAGCVAALAAATFHLAEPHLHLRDFTQIWRAGSLLLDGLNPYDHITRGGVYPFSERLGYPLTAAVWGMLFAPLSPVIVTILWAGGSTALLTYALTRDGLWRLPMLWSASFAVALYLNQWSIVLTAAALLPALGVLAACKPNLGLALFARQPTWWMIFGGAALTVVAFALVPTWPLDWLRSIKGQSYYASAASIVHAGGPLLLLAALRWRDRDARMLLMLSVVPTNLILYDQLLLFLIPRRLWQVLLLTANSLLIMGLSEVYPDPVITDEVVRQVYMRAPVVALLFIPALLMVLSRPSPVESPDVVDRVRDQLRSAIQAARAALKLRAADVHEHHGA